MTEKERILSAVVSRIIPCIMFATEKEQKEVVKHCLFNPQELKQGDLVFAFTTIMGRRKNAKDNSNPPAEWDKEPPNEVYFRELFRVSKKQIIWGGNYFSLPPTKCFLIWRKPQISENVSFSMCEYAWTNLDGTSKEWIGMSNERDHIHPTQKPVALYEWILTRYAKEGDIILNTHVGSASSLIACRNTNHRFVGFEIDEHYYKLSKERLERKMAQMNLFDFMRG